MGSPTSKEGSFDQALQTVGMESIIDQSKATQDLPTTAPSEGLQSENTVSLPVKPELQDKTETPKSELESSEQVKPEAVAGKVEGNKPAINKTTVTQKEQNLSNRNETAESVNKADVKFLSTPQNKSELIGNEEKEKEKEKQRTDRPRQPVVLNPVLRHKSQPDVMSVDVNPPLRHKSQPNVMGFDTMEKPLKTVRPEAQSSPGSVSSESTQTQPAPRKFLVKKVEESSVEPVVSAPTRKEPLEQAGESTTPAMSSPAHSSAKEPVPVGEHSNNQTVPKADSPSAVPSSVYSSVQTQTSFDSSRPPPGKEEAHSAKVPNAEIITVNSSQPDSGSAFQPVNESSKSRKETSKSQQQPQFVKPTTDNAVKSTGRFTITKPIEQIEKGDQNAIQPRVNGEETSCSMVEIPRKICEDALIKNISQQETESENLSSPAREFPDKSYLTKLSSLSKSNTEPLETAGVQNQNEGTERTGMNPSENHVEIVSSEADASRKLSGQSSDGQPEQLKPIAEQESEITLQDICRHTTPSITPSSSMESLNSISSQHSSSAYLQTHNSFSPQTVDTSGENAVTSKSQHPSKQSSQEGESKMQTDWVSSRRE